MLAADKENECQVEKVIVETLEYFKTLNPEALACKNGDRIVKPAWQIEQEKQQRVEYEKML